jgi:lipoyl(octanoyl) transferase
LISVNVEDWGLVEYQQALDRQLSCLELVAQNPNTGFIIFCSHPAVVTVGRKTQPGDVTEWQGPLIEIARGGRATYHGPSQLVVYPILPLDQLEKNRDIGWFLRTFEASIVATLAHYDITARGKSDGKNLEDTGVWVGEKKITSIGIGVKKWISYHGAAINLFKDESAFKGIKPCGYEPNIMISFEELSAQKIKADSFQNQLLQNLSNLFGLKINTN